MKYNFDEVLDRSKLSTMKWEAQMKRKNDDSLLCFGTADMDFKSAQPIIDAIQKVVDVGHFGYPYKRQSYYDAIIGWFKRRCNWEIRQEWIANSLSIYPAFQSFIDGLTEVGDEVIIQTPVHFVFEEIIHANGRITVENPLQIKDGKYIFNIEDFKAKISPKTKLLILCNPQNPVGRVWTREELTEIANICLQHGIVILSDEVYMGLTYEGYTHIPIASISKEVSLNTITLASPSKSFNVTGLKHSLVITENQKFQEIYQNELLKNDQHFGESIFGHVATEAAFAHCDEWIEQLMTYVEGNYHTVYEFMKINLPEVKVYKPESTYFVWLDFNFLGMSDSELTSFFEDQARTIVNQGYSLGTGGSGFIRINIGCPKQILEQGLQRIKNAYDQLK
ncbi:MalY/PatB family protein [Brevibacillus sp. NRS-1366]|uniref:MalY/PatB family protein n=1 Tax=Brevibacillus sp. NRS-1366 TaxID=3233899 RepID=UPI003D2153B1